MDNFDNEKHFFIQLNTSPRVKMTLGIVVRLSQDSIVWHSFHSTKGNNRLNYGIRIIKKRQKEVVSTYQQLLHCCHELHSIPYNGLPRQQFPGKPFQFILQFLLFLSDGIPQNCSINSQLKRLIYRNLSCNY